MSELTLESLVTTAHAVLSLINEHPDYLRLEYYPDMTIPDALMAVEQLRDELREQDTVTLSIRFPFETESV